MRSATAGDRGETLIEILAALTVLGIGITALLGGLATNITATSVNRSQSQASATLLSASEYVKSLGTVTCGAAPVTVLESQVPHDSAVFTITYGGAVDFNAGTPCTSLQRVPVRVVGDGFDMSLDVVKRP